MAVYTLEIQFKYRIATYAVTYKSLHHDLVEGLQPTYTRNSFIKTQMALQLSEQW